MPPGAKFAGLRLQYLAATSAPDPFWDAFQETGDATAFAISWANTMRAIAAPTIVAALDIGRDQLVDELFQRVAQRISAAPVKYDWDLAAVVMSKDQ